MGRLEGKIAVVTGASRGAGRGIALVLGEDGAMVYVTGRSSGEGGSTAGLPGTVEETAEAGAPEADPTAQVPIWGGSILPLSPPHPEGVTLPGSSP